MGLEIGADDYLPKTFSTRELLARLRAVTRRARKPLSGPPPVRELVAGDLRISEEIHSAVMGDQPLDRTALEFAILSALMKAKGRVKTRERLIEEVSDGGLMFPSIIGGAMNWGDWAARSPRWRGVLIFWCTGKSAS